MFYSITWVSSIVILTWLVCKEKQLARVKDKQILDLASFKDHLFILVRKESTALYELLDEQFNVVAADNNYAALAVSEQYLIVPSGNAVYLYQ